MPVEVIVAIIGAIEAIGVAIIGGIITANRRKDESDREERAKKEEAREIRDSANYDLLFAVADGVEVLLEQARGDKLNGNVDKALKSVELAKSQCNHFYNKQMAKL